MRRFFINDKAIRGKRVIIDGEEAHHIRDVIRLKPGDRFLGLDGSGKTYTLRIRKVASAIEAEIEKVSSKGSNMPRILLACALPKKEKMGYIIEKATELGVSEIVPMVTERTVVKINDKNRAGKQSRWEKIALEASKQCGRAILPRIYEIMNFRDAVKLTDDSGYKKKILPCLCEGRKGLNEALAGKIKDAAIFIGPEGDFSGKEIDFAKDSGFESVSLGELILKVDTACIFALSVIRGQAFSAIGT